MSNNTFETVNLFKYISLVKSGVSKFSGEKKYIATGSLETNKIVDCEFVTYDSRPSRANMEFKAEDIIFAKMKDTEKVFLIDSEVEKNIYSTGFTGFRIKDKTKILPEYLFYYILSDVFQKEKNKNCTGATQKAINNTKLKQFTIKLPSIKIQKELIKKISKTMNLKKLREESNRLLDSFLKSVFMEMFGNINLNPKNWKIKQIKDISEVKTGATPSRKIDEYWKSGYIPWVKTTEVNGSLIESVQEHITNFAIQSTNVKIFPKGTILIAMYGQGKTRGQCGKLGIDAATNQACAAILPSNKFNIDYLLYFLFCSYDNLRNLGRGGNQPNLNLSMIKDFEVYLPPMELQNQFAEIVQNVENIKKYQNQSKEELDNLFNNLMQKAFKGELTC